MVTSSAGLSREFTVHFATGTITTEELRTAAVEFVRDAPTRLALWDFTGADFSALPAAGLASMFDGVILYMEKCLGGRWALLFGSPVGFGLGRMSEAMAEVREYSYQVKAFRDRDAAMRWLELPQEEAEEGEGVA